MMKIAKSTFKEGGICFLFTPLLMSLLFFSTQSGTVNQDTELHPFIGSFINFRYSSESFFLVIFVCIVVCFISTAIIKTQPIPRKEQNKIGKVFNYASTFIAKMIMFWAGVFFAWSFGSLYIPFITKIPDQELMVPLLLWLAILSRYGLLKLKHVIIRG